MEINYVKRDNKNLFKDLSNIVCLDNAQNYNPLLKSYFNLNESNFNCIELNNQNHLDSITEKVE